jgi:hypothetical protein
MCAKSNKLITTNSPRISSVRISIIPKRMSIGTGFI